MPFGVIYHQFKNLFDKIFGRFPKRVVNFLKAKGDLRITSIVIKRDPIQSILDKVLNIVSLGKFSELKHKYGYDELYHLRMVVTLSDGKSFTIEKNQVINIGGPVAKDTSQTQSIDVPLNGKNITLNMLVEKTIKNVGEDRFLKYDAFDTNCQRFILDLLESNGLSSPDVRDFVLQDVSQLVKELPSFVEKTAKDLTDVAGYADRFRQALGFRKGGRVRRRMGRIY